MRSWSPTAMFLLLLFFLCPALGAFIKSRDCLGDYYEYLVLQPFVVDVAFDEANQKLKFLINTEAIKWPNYTDTKPIITDVNLSTNRYTTFHAEINFMGKTFIDENLRFCDMVAVKRNTQFQDSPRFTNNQSDWESLLYQQLHQLGENGSQPLVNLRRELLESFGDIPSAEDDISSAEDDWYGPGENTAQNSLLRRHSNGLPKAHQGLLSKRLLNANAKLNSKTASTSLLSNHSIPLMASSNDSISAIFDNSTGALVQCPIYNNDLLMLYYEADVSDHFHRLGSYTVRFSVIANDDVGLVLSCNSMYVTPVQLDWISDTLFIGILVLLLVTGFVNLFTVICLSYQELSNPLLFIASTICNGDLLRQLDATCERIVMYLQFALFMGGLGLNYPGFYQPLIGQLRWCALLGFSLMHRGPQMLHSQLDNVYVTFNSGGLKLLAQYSNNNQLAHDLWPNFVLCMVCWVIVVCGLQQVLLVVKWAYDRALGRRSTLVNLTKNFYYMVGQALNVFLLLFGFPFLVLTTFMFNVARESNGKRRYYPDPLLLQANAFDISASYEDLFVPQYYLQLTTNKTSKADLRTRADFLILLQLNITDLPLNFTITTTDRFLQIPAGSICIGLVLFALWIGLVLFFVFRFVVSVSRRGMAINPNVSKLYTSMVTILAWAFSYNHYRPNKVYYVIWDYASVLLKLLVIALLQDDGCSQVVCLIVLGFLDLVALFAIRPYFLKLTWTTTRWILPVARFIVTVMSIAFLENLHLSETTRTYVAYAQLIVHVVMALVFVVQLAYCLCITIVSMVKVHRERVQYHKYLGPASETVDDFNKQFEYQPTHHQPLLFVEPAVGLEPPTETIYDPLTSYNQTGASYASNFKRDDTEDYYYRSKSQRLLLLLHPVDEKRTSSLSASDDITDTSDEQGSFKEQQQNSIIRRRRNDYTVREGDRIYKRYFENDSIDPEVKALWDSRNKRLDQESKEGARAQARDSLFSKIKASVMEKPPAEMGFHVSRPRPLVIRSLADIETGRNQQVPHLAVDTALVGSRAHPQED